MAHPQPSHASGDTVIDRTVDIAFELAKVAIGAVLLMTGVGRFRRRYDKPDPQEQLLPFFLRDV